MDRRGHPGAHPPDLGLLLRDLRCHRRQRRHVVLRSLPTSRRAPHDRTPSATSLTTAPEVDARSRTRRYVIMMSVRVLCFILMVTVTPYGWQTWIFAAGAAVLPYLAVVIANVGNGDEVVVAERPSREIESTPSASTPPEDPNGGVIRIQESPPQEDR
ncbi:DUF3099 domain-containing protein [Microbacterium oleivorans]|uniref:DUF3099 domain-containing protein n=1 Tax=Microbacterium oleivorans TaxID=273677 RepID=UPI001CB8F72E|nr:DUF3099 domain-containing protein [Microbacterium oleivorans]